MVNSERPGETQVPVNPRSHASSDTEGLRYRLHDIWSAIVGGLGVVVGLLPHVLHHVALLSGTALVAGSGGTALFAVLGLLASIPLLLRLHRRYETWAAPAIGLLVFATMFSISAFVIGPSLSGTTDLNLPSTPGMDHSSHH